MGLMRAGVLAPDGFWEVLLRSGTYHYYVPVECGWKGPPKELVQDRAGPQGLLCPGTEQKRPQTEPELEPSGQRHLELSEGSG